MKSPEFKINPEDQLSPRVRDIGEAQKQAAKDVKMEEGRIIQERYEKEVASGLRKKGDYPEDYHHAVSYGFSVLPDKESYQRWKQRGEEFETTVKELSLKSPEALDSEYQEIDNQISALDREYRQKEQELRKFGEQIREKATKLRRQQEAIYSVMEAGEKSAA